MLAACDGDTPTSLDEVPEGLIVTWYATSVRAGGTELMDDGMRLRLTFSSNGTYRFDVTRDRTGFVCDVDILDCVSEGAFEASATEVVFDPGADEARLSATLTDTSLRLSGTVDGTAVDVSLVLPPYPDLIGTWVATSLLNETGEIQEGGVTTTFVVTFEVDGRYTYASTFSPPDLFCDFDLSCLDGGTYVADADVQEIRFDAGSPGALTMQISVLPTQLMLSGMVDGGLQDWTFSELEIPSPGVDGNWSAVSLKFDGVELIQGVAEPATHRLVLAGTQYSSSTIANAPGPFLCSTPDAVSECGSSGGFTAGLDTFEFLDGLAMGAQRVSVTTTPTSLRLSGMIDGKSADFLYGRVPNL